MPIKSNPHPSDDSLLALYNKLTEANCLNIIGREGHTWFKGPAFTEGIETHTIDGVEVRIYSPEKTLADCFKHRNKIGVDVAVEALKLYRKHKPLRADELVRYAKICRVEKIMRPYLEAIL